MIVSGANNRTLLAVDLLFEAHLHIDVPMEKALAERFTQTDFRLIVLPYARYAISNVTAQMSIPPIVIPLLALQAP